MAIALAGCTASPKGAPGAPDPTVAPEAAPTAPPWEPDLVVEREFPDADGTLVPCTIFIRAAADEATASDDALERLAAAQAHLRAGDWSTVPVSLDSMPADEQESRRAQGVSDPELYTMVLTHLIDADFSATGLLGVGVSKEGYVTCGDA